VLAIADRPGWFDSADDFHRRHSRSPSSGGTERRRCFHGARAPPRIVAGRRAEMLCDQGRSVVVSAGIPSCFPPRERADGRKRAKSVVGRRFWRRGRRSASEMIGVDEKLITPTHGGTRTTSTAVRPSGCGFTSMFPLRRRAHFELGRVRSRTSGYTAGGVDASGCDASSASNQLPQITVSACMSSHMTKFANISTHSFSEPQRSCSRAIAWWL
jgi:hypothetical protein